MKKICCILILLPLLLCACKGTAPAPAGFRVSSCSQEEAENADFSIAYYTLPGENDFPQTFSKAFRFEGLQKVEYDTYKEPFRFDEDKSVWATYEKTQESFDVHVGRCISSEEDVDFIRKTLVDREYREDPNTDAAYFTPRFELRQGKECIRCNDRFPVGVTYYLDDYLYQYYVKPDGTVLRWHGADQLESSAEALPPEDVARLYFIYEAYYHARDIFMPGPHPYDDIQTYTLYVERNGERLSVPSERIDEFLSLVTVDEDRVYSENEPRCCAITNMVYAGEDHASSEVLRFLVYPTSSDVNSYPAEWWFSLREDGKIVRKVPHSTGHLWPSSDRWEVRSLLLQISKAAFDVSAINAFVDACQ